MRRMQLLPTSLLLLVTLFLVACEREIRNFRPQPPYAETVQWVRMTDLQPGRVDPVGATEGISASWANEYEENAYAVAEGKRLYSAFNCNGCHAHGGGDIGPPLLDSKWIYGYQPEQIFSTIVEGRPNGMPSFGGRIPEYQIWQLVAYVRSMSGLLPKDVAPGRNDDMKSNPPENSKDPETPVNSALPKSAEMPQ